LTHDKTKTGHCSPNHVTTLQSVAYYCHPQAVSERIELFTLWAVVFFGWENSLCTFSRHHTSVRQWCQCIRDISV